MSTDRVCRTSQDRCSPEGKPQPLLETVPQFTAAESSVRPAAADGSSFCDGKIDMQDSNATARQSLRSHPCMTETFEAEYNEICTLLANCRQSTPGSRHLHRQANAVKAKMCKELPDTDDSIRQQPAHQSDNKLSTAAAGFFQEGDHQELKSQNGMIKHTVVSHDDIANLLMGRALHLKQLLANLALSVRESNLSKSLYENSSERRSEAFGFPALQKAKDVAHLAALRALTSSKALTSSHCSQTSTEVVQCDLGNGSTCVAQRTVENNDHANNGKMFQASNQQLTLRQNDDNRLHDSSRAGGLSTTGMQREGDVTAQLRISQLHELVLSRSGKQLIHAAKEPAVWLAWRMPGSASARPWLRVAALKQAPLLQSGKQFILACEGDTSASCEVHLRLFLSSTSMFVTVLHELMSMTQEKLAAGLLDLFQPAGDEGVRAFTDYAV